MMDRNVVYFEDEDSESKQEKMMMIVIFLAKTLRGNEIRPYVFEWACVR